MIQWHRSAEHPPLENTEILGWYERRGIRRVDFRYRAAHGCWLWMETDLSPWIYTEQPEFWSEINTPEMMDDLLLGM